MVHYRNLTAVSALCLFGCSPSEPPGDTGSSPGGAPAAADGWRVLFDGSSLDAWNAVGDANWEIVDDTVRADSGNGFLVSNESYTDFDLSVEFWVDVEANSGVFIRCSSAEQIGADTCYEVNIFDTRADQTYRTGSIVDYASPSQFIYTGGQWNTFEITADGQNLSVTLNGVNLVETQDSTYASGPIALQYGAGTVMFRNVRIRAR